MSVGSTMAYVHRKLPASGVMVTDTGNSPAVAEPAAAHAAAPATRSRAIQDPRVMKNTPRAIGGYQPGGGRIRRPPRPVNRRCAAPAGYARRRRRANPTTGNPTAASANVAGSGTDGVGPAGTGTTVSVMFVSTSPSDVRCVVAVKNESVCVPNDDSAQKFPSPTWPDVTVGPVYVQVRLSINGSSPGLTRSGVGPTLTAAEDQSAGWVRLPGTRPPKS